MIDPDRWKQIETLFHAALERNHRERSGFLDAACGNDAAMRAEVESLLNQNSIADFLDGPSTVIPGTRLGPYEIRDQIGSGGMGDVYSATDTRLDRTVAIKVLPEHLADDSQRRERFEREAKAVSSLNHPHICTLHDVGEQDGTHYLVMELVEGDTLAARLEKGRLRLDQALEYAIQISDALDRAHRKGIVHRDLKPGNIMLTKSGVKLLDFGLAKLKGDAGPASSLSQMAIADGSKPLTAEGTILGTLQYMAPEQLEGKDADSRTDIFAFGAVVYEMVTGKRAFEGTSQASLIGAIMHSEPQPISSLEPMTPAGLDYVIDVCVSKDPDDRWQTARDLFRELKRIEADGAVPTEPALAPGLRSRVGWRPRVPLAIATLVVGSLIAGLALWIARTPAPQRLARFVVTTVPDGPLRVSAFQTDVTISPDGMRIIYVARGAGVPDRQLYVRQLDEIEPTPLRGGAGGASPFVSPDGEWVGFFDTRDDSLKKVSILGACRQ